MRLKVRAFQTGKSGHDASRCADVFGYSASDTVDDDVVFSCAVSDGASGSFQPRTYAAALVAAWIDNAAVPAVEAVALGIEHGRKAWLEEMHKLNATPNVPFYLQHAASNGMCATFLGVRIESVPYADWLAVWDAAAIGDSCLMVFDSNHRVRETVPETPVFGNQPDLLCSNREAGVLLSARKTGFGLLEWSERLVLATDAVAEYLLKLDGARATDEVRRWLMLETEAEFLELVERARHGTFRTSDGTVVMKNDDATLMFVGVLGEHEIAATADSEVAQ